MILQIFIIVFLVILWIFISFITFFFVVDVTYRKRLNLLLNFFKIEESYSIYEKIYFIRDLQKQTNNKVLKKLIYDTLSFYENIYITNCKIYRMEINYLIKNQKLFIFNFKEAFSKLSNIGNILENQYIYLEKLNFYCSKTYEYKKNTSDLFFELENSLFSLKQKANSFELHWLKKFDKKISLIKNKIEILEKNNNFPSLSFENEIKNLIHDINFFNYEAMIYINNLLNIRYINLIIEQINSKIEISKVEMNGMVIEIIEDFYFIKDEIKKIESKIININQFKLKKFLSNINTFLENIDNLLFKEYFSKKTILLIQQNLNKIINVIEKQQQVVLNEITIKKEYQFLSNYENIVNNLNNIKKEASFLNLIKLDSSDKYSNYILDFSLFLEKTKKYNKEIDDIAIELSKKNQIRNELNKTIIETNTLLLECEVLAKKIPFEFVIKYDYLIDEYSIQENNYINNFKNNPNFAIQSNLDKVKILNKNVIELKEIIKDKLFNINYISKLIINLNKYASNEVVTQKLKKVEELMLKDKFKQAYEIIYQITKHDIKKIK